MVKKIPSFFILHCYNLFLIAIISFAIIPSYIFSQQSTSLNKNSNIANHNNQDILLSAELLYQDPLSFCNISKDSLKNLKQIKLYNTNLIVNTLNINKSTFPVGLYIVKKNSVEEMYSQKVIRTK